MLRRIGLALLLAVAALCPALADDFPSKSIKILVGAAPGGLIDLFARTYAAKLQERSGRPVVVENNSIATGIVAADFVAKAPRRAL
jgi:tripartite-type tricarboxylate transporter receptor subunit TctC